MTARSVIDLSTRVVSHASVVFKRNRFDKKQKIFYQLTLTVTTCYNIREDNDLRNTITIN